MAAGTYERYKALTFYDRLVEMANVAMLVWSAGIDLISVHILLGGETGLGTSVSRRRYLTNRILPATRSALLRPGWRALARLHGFQHNLDMSETAFAADCHDSALLLSDLNALIPVTLRLPPDAYDWLAEVS